MPILLFDGVCNLCNGAVQFVIRHDKRQIFQFAALQSEAGQAILRKHNLDTATFDSLVLLDERGIATRSTGALRLAWHLGGVWRVLYALVVVPPWVRDGVYGWVARNRYRWFGERAACMIPTAALRKRFL